jgi:hypothetical protein
MHEYRQNKPQYEGGHYFGVNDPFFAAAYPANQNHARQDRDRKQ